MRRSEDFYTVYRANAVHLGKLEPRIAKQIVKVYVLVKAHVENLRINNRMLDESDDLHEKRMNVFPAAISPNASESLAGRAQAGGFAVRRERIQNLLVEHARFLKKHQPELKREYSLLCGLLDSAEIKQPECDTPDALLVALESRNGSSSHPTPLLERRINRWRSSSPQVDCVGMRFQEFSEFLSDALDHGINRVNFAISREKGISWEQVVYQQAAFLIVVCAIRELSVCLPPHQTIKCFL